MIRTRQRTSGNSIAPSIFRRSGDNDESARLRMKPNGHERRVAYSCESMPIRDLSSGPCIFLVLWCSVSSGGANTLDRWHWRNPSPPLNPINALAYADGKFVAVGGWLGMVLVSSDGTNWSQQGSVTDEA